LEENQSFLITDFDREGLEPPHDGIASALLVPILQRNKAVGAIHLHSNRTGHFTPEMTEFIQALAGQVGIAITNAQTFQNEQKSSVLQRRRADTLKKLAEVGSKLSEELPLESALQTIAMGIREATPFRVVLVSILEKENGLLRRITAVGIAEDTLKGLIARKQPLTALQHLMQPQFKIGHSYHPCRPNAHSSS
jgi:transcriptional regulator with GAF, ATPase, and Fis domain